MTLAWLTAYAVVVARWATFCAGSACAASSRP